MNGGLAGGARLGWLVALAARRQALLRLYASPAYRWRYGRGEPERLVLAPQDLRTADPTRAEEILEGRFCFVGKTVDLADGTPFDTTAPSRAWQEALLGFSWLRHLRVAEGAAGSSVARNLVAAFMRSAGQFDSEALDPSTTARRLLALLSQSPLVLEGADRGFYKAFVRSLFWQARYLAQVGPVVRDGLPRLVCAIAATQASICLSEAAALRRQAMRFLALELDRQVLPDGGHVSRNPHAVIELLLDLLPLRQSCSARNVVPPPELLNAIDRLMPMLRFFRHVDGAIAAFNGMGYTQTDLIATLLSYDDTRGRPMQNAPHSGYQRVDAGGAVLLVDTGKVPPVGVSQDAHAGALSFEFSVAGARIIVNCGAPGPSRESWKQPARLTAAHSTASVGNRSSATFAPESGLSSTLDRPITTGPRVLTLERREDVDAVTLTLSHDGYRQAFGLIHERSLSLATASGALEGHDAFVTPSRAPWRGRDKITLRFHLHPLVICRAGRVESEAMLDLPSGPCWRFLAEGQALQIEESVHFANPEGPRRTHQIVIELEARDGVPDGVSWSLEPLS